MRNGTYVKTNVYDIENEKKLIEVIVRIISIDNRYFFAEEISTGCIFPIFNCINSKFFNNKIYMHSFSYMNCCKYPVFFPLVGSDDDLKFIVDVHDRDFNDLGFPDKTEISLYLKNMKKDRKIRKQIIEMESQNEYLCDINVIKNIVSSTANDLNLPSLNLDNSDLCEQYTPCVKLNKISNFGYDLSQQKDLCNLIGRTEEIKKIIKTTCIREKSIILIGEAGAGKTSIVEKLALDIKEGNNEWLKNKMIFFLNLSALQADTKYRGEFENNINEVIDFCKANKGRIILFIDEIHTLYGLGRTDESSIDAMNILKPYISNGTIVVIGATTKYEYEKYMVNDSAFLRRFEKLDISLPDRNMNINILLEYIKYLETKYKLKLNVDDDQKREVAEYIIDATDIKKQKVIGDAKITNPTLAKYVIEDAFVETLYNKKDLVSVEDICISLLSCDKLPPTTRKETAVALKSSINTINNSVDNAPTLVRVK